MAQSALKLLVSVSAVLAMGPSVAAGQPVGPTWTHRVRTGNPRLAAAIVVGMARSDTFRDLVERVDRTDGIVFVTNGRCGQHGTRACLSHTLTLAGPSRLLHVIVNAAGPQWDLIGSLGHELTHALEVLGDPTITSGQGIYFFYQRVGPRSGNRFETSAAIAAGERVRREIREGSRAGYPYAAGGLPSSPGGEFAQEPELGELPVALDRRR